MNSGAQGLETWEIGRGGAALMANVLGTGSAGYVGYP